MGNENGQHLLVFVRRQVWTRNVKTSKADIDADEDKSLLEVVWVIRGWICQGHVDYTFCCFPLACDLHSYNMLTIVMFNYEMERLNELTDYGESDGQTDQGPYKCLHSLK